MIILKKKRKTLFAVSTMREVGVIDIEKINIFFPLCLYVFGPLITGGNQTKLTLVLFITLSQSLESITKINASKVVDENEKQL